MILEKTLTCTESASIRIFFEDSIFVWLYSGVVENQLSLEAVEDWYKCDTAELDQNFNLAKYVNM